MKLSWFSPLPPAHTEIGNVTGRMLPALASAFDLTVYTEAPAWDPDLDRHCPITTFGSETIDWKTLNLSGLPVYHIGNNIHFHGEIIKVARRCPGTVVLHDLALHETILNLCLRKGSGRAGYFDILHKYGREPAVRAGRAFLDEGAGDTNQLSVEYPLFEYVLENAVGVITHNPLNAAFVRKASGAPVLYAPLPFLDRGRMAPPVVRAPRESEPYRILIFGFLGSDNRRLHPFLKALSECAASGRFTLTLAGKYDEKKVKSWIQNLGLSGRTTLRGFVSDGELDALLA
ncbi:MAG TPA: hypothetical protein VJ960_07860, partial [Oceanipulchritudo sp.]|nr:hypothetical protein [Oceanipulchritudo sp.]